MRISHLREREPIDEIVAATLSKFWSRQFGGDYSAKFAPARAAKHRRQAANPTATTWICNSWLNVIFPLNATTQAFEPISREYARSTIAWRRPLQQLYVRLATTPRWGRLFGHGRMMLNREIPDQSDTIVVPGNSKIRILKRGQGCCFGLLKSNFPSARYLNELDARQSAADHGVQVPPILERNDQQGWFQEKYIAATPINRLPDPLERQAAIERAATNLSPFIANTSKTVPTAEYVHRCIDLAQHLMDANSLLTTDRRRLLKSLLSHLSERVFNENHTALITSETHGDFQDANVLVDDDHTWIIDWEYSSRRQTGFDAITSMTQARSPVGLAQRLQDFVAGTDETQLEVVRALNSPGIDWHIESQRRFAINLYLIEELVFHLQENDNPIFRKLNHGFEPFVCELEAWLA